MSGVALRPARLGDIDGLHAVFTQPGVRRHLFDDVLLSREETRRHVEAACAHGAWVVCLEGAVVGLVGLRPTGQDRELIVAIAEACWGKGIAFAAASAAMRHGFDVVGLDRIVALVDLPNARSHRLMARLGFVPCGESEGATQRLRTYEALRRSGT